MRLIASMFVVFCKPSIAITKKAHLTSTNAFRMFVVFCKPTLVVCCYKEKYQMSTNASRMFVVFCKPILDSLRYCYKENVRFLTCISHVCCIL